MKVLVACEFSGIVRDAFIKIGHYALSCDLLDTERPGNHFKGDVKEIINDNWDLIIAHPPCTYLCNSGVRWLYNKDKTKNHERWEKLTKAVEFFKEIQNNSCKMIAIENPIPHKYARQKIGQYSQTIQPYHFGHTESKRTCLWLKNLPLLVSTNDVYEEFKNLPKSQTRKIHLMPPGKDRSKNRSRTYQGIANAMAEQWG